MFECSQKLSESLHLSCEVDTRFMHIMYSVLNYVYALGFKTYTFIQIDLMYMAFIYLHFKNQTNRLAFIKNTWLVYIFNCLKLEESFKNNLKI